MSTRCLLPLMVGLLVSCSEQKATDTDPEDETAPPAPEHPWDWVPSNPSLVAGRTIYLAECALCHNEGEEGAPALTNSDQWSRRIAKGEDTLIRHALEGFIGEDGEMPARGGTDTLTDEEVGAAVRYMIATKKKIITPTHKRPITNQ